MAEDALFGLAQAFCLEPPVAAVRFVRDNADCYERRMSDVELAAAVYLRFANCGLERLNMALRRLAAPPLSMSRAIECLRMIQDVT